MAPRGFDLLSGAWLLSLDTLSFLSQTQVGGEKVPFGALMAECHQQQHSRPVQIAFLSRDHTNKTYLMREKGEQVTPHFGALILLEVRTHVNVMQSGKKRKENGMEGASLGVQWLRLCASNARPGNQDPTSSEV